MSRADRLIGREPALAAASLVVDDARRGAGQFLMISGEAGIGKTSMLAALVSRAGPTPLVLRGFCWEGDGAPPYWPWSQVLQASGLPMADLGEAGWLLQPASSPAEPMSAVAAGDAQFRLFEAVARCLGRLAAGRPVLVVLDDLHWADVPSLRLLGFLARALVAESVALLGAYRDTEAPPRSCTRSPARPSNSPWPASVRATSGRWPGSWPGRPFRPTQPPSCGSAAAATRSSSGNWSGCSSRRAHGSSRPRSRPASRRRCGGGWPGSPRNASGCWSGRPSRAATSTSACWRTAPRPAVRPRR
jgi:hypothetical protein